MVRGGKIASRKNFNHKFRPKDKGSDDSDEDYVVSNDENGVSECSDDDYCSSLDEHASGEDNFFGEEEVEEQQQKKVRKKVGSKARSAFSSHKARKNHGRKRRRFSYEEEEDDDNDADDKDYKVDDDNDYEVEEEEEEEDVDEEVDEEVEDEDFMLEEEDFSDEEELCVRKKGSNTKLGRHGVQKNTLGKVCKKRKPKAGNKSSRSKRRKRSYPQTTVSNSDDGDFSDNWRTVKKSTRSKKPVPKRKRYVVQSDLETFVSGSSDYEYTISEEEREQVREAERLCGDWRNRIRSVPSPPKTEDSDLRRLRKPPVRKGKEKVEEIKVEVIKQVCGICLSEEDKRRVRGTLNCCSHFFCFSCIMEWAKVESRCPLCKQRFQTISKPARSTAGIELREVVIQIPERDQVYQPSEEELRSYLDPYENVICIECHEGGDDNLMLLCDLCDSPAHTYCVGLGREVPEGNWYCVDCRTNALGSSSPQPPGRLSDRRTTNNLFNRTVPAANREGLDLNSLSSPRTPYIQGFGNVTSPRFPVEVQATCPMSQADAPTLARRRILRLHINHIRSSNQMGLVNNRTGGVSATNPCGGGSVNLQIGQGRETMAENTRTHEMAIPTQSLLAESLHDNPSPLMQHGDFLDSETSHLPRQAMQDPPHLSMPTDRASSNGTILNPLTRLGVETTTTTVDRNLNGTLWPEISGVNSLSNCGQIHHYSSALNTGSDNGLLPPSVGDEKDYCAAREQLQPIIQTHLRNLPRDIDLGQSKAAEIARKATCTILAACGFEHLINEAYESSSPPSQCSHIELSMGGHRSLIKGLCSVCFDSYVQDVVKKITDDILLPQWLSLTL